MAKLALLGGSRACTESFPAWPEYDELEEAALLRVLRSRRWGGWPYPGPETCAFLDEFLAFQGGQHAVACANGTVTMEVALRAAGIGWGDEVIVPSYTFQATAVAPLSVGATPVLVDVDPNTYCIDPECVERAITSRTKAVIAVHVGDQLSDMDAMVGLAKRHDLVLIEDAAHAHGARWREQGIGTFGEFGSFSLQSNKLLTAGEGGVLVCRSAAMAERAASILDNGRPYLSGGRLRGGEPCVLGSNSRMTEFQAALARTGLTRLPEQTRQRAAAAARLDGALVGIPGVRLLRRDERCTQRTLFGYICAIDPDVFGLDHRVVCHLLNSEGVPCWAGYQPLHRDALFRPLRSQLPLVRLYPDRVHYDDLELPNAERASREAVWLREQVFRGSMKGIDGVAEALQKIYEHRRIIAPRQSELMDEWQP
jgi:dTDP-4-amino-4,6-dideoxygalactose transaminase